MYSSQFSRSTSMFSFEEVLPVPMRIAGSRQIGSHVQQVELTFDPGAFPEVFKGAQRWRSQLIKHQGAHVGLHSSLLLCSRSRGIFCGHHGELLWDGRWRALLCNVASRHKSRRIRPFDDYQYRPGTGRPKVFIAAGTGVAPFVRMVPQAVAEGVPVLLVLGVHAQSLTFCTGTTLQKLRQHRKTFSTFLRYLAAHPSGTVNAATSRRTSIAFRTSPTATCTCAAFQKW